MVKLLVVLSLVKPVLLNVFLLRIVVNVVICFRHVFGINNIIGIHISTFCLVLLKFVSASARHLSLLVNRRALWTLHVESCLTQLIYQIFYITLILRLCNLHVILIDFTLFLVWSTLYPWHTTRALLVYHHVRLVLAVWTTSLLWIEIPVRHLASG